MPVLAAKSFLISTFLAALSLSPHSATANPLPTAAPAIDFSELQNATFLFQKRCDNPCGWSEQLCCGSSETCYTDSSDQAQCATAGVTSASGDGYWQYYTSTWVETEKVTKTSIWSDWVGASVTAESTATSTSVTCNWSDGESSCGDICCTSDQYCMLSGQCAAIGVTTSPGVTATGTGSSESYSAPLRPTTGTLIVITATSSPTTTVPYETPVATGANVTLSEGSTSSSGGLSGGAIAGIVIGVLAGIILLALLCLFCCFKAAWDGILALLGIGGKKRRTREEYVEERYHRSSGGGSHHSGWYDNRPSRPPPPKKSSGFGGFGGVLAGLGALALALGFKRKHDRRQDEKSEYTDYNSSYYYSDYDTSESSASSGDRTHHTRYTHSRR